jgi:hypothetical protein
VHAYPRLKTTAVECVSTPKLAARFNAINLRAEWNGTAAAACSLGVGES